MKYNVGIVGATGMVGQNLIKIINDHPWFNIKILAASSSSAKKKYIDVMQNRWCIKGVIPEKYRNMIIYDAINDVEYISKNVDFIFCAVNIKKSELKILEEKYAKYECPVISNNSAHRETKDVPMIIPEINFNHSQIINKQKERLKTKKGFIAVKSNCSIQSYVPALNAIKEYGLLKVAVSTYQAISGNGKTFNTWPEMNDNIIPYINGEEEKSEKEPLKIWGNIINNEIINAKYPIISAQCIRVPVTNGHFATVFVKLKNIVSIKEIINKIETFKSPLELPSSPKKFLTYYHELDRPQISLDRDLYNGMGISVGRIRKDNIFDFKFVSLSHNIIRGAAGGAILLAELLCYQNYI